MIRPCSPTEQRELAISRAMERLMQGCDAMIGEIPTPFRGPSTDVGSAYEMGFMRALGRPILAYSNDDRLVSRSCSPHSAAAPCMCVRQANLKTPTAWQSSRSRCTTISCSSGAS